MLSGAREAGCFREVAVLHSDHLRQVPLYVYIYIYIYIYACSNIILYILYSLLTTVAVQERWEYVVCFQTLRELDQESTVSSGCKT